ncbi:hypothetical protein DERP_002406 [Dermatophagoides pteronyssinus]|uniref:Transmembrane protein n=1 Tax=Dermatophagoides pteronyssinus TaxID=6956 RepID=A0ABQ8JHN5_DERPT|nr:hypothetical protein DERP_002406 [Dermatophagoides pteronyssinus]
MKNIMCLKISILFFYFIRRIVSVEVQHEKSNDQIMIPYKSVYGVPSKCTGTSDHKTTEKEYRTCQINAIKKWKIEIQHYYTESWNFCCFVYDVLECETKVLSECDANYSDRNDKETRRLFDKSCQPIMANNPCSKSKDGGDNTIWIILGIAAGAIITLIVGCIFFWRKQLNPESNAKKAYKAEKFQKIYEMEYARAVYDHEVDNLNNKSLQNASKQTGNNEEPQPIKKEDEVQILKKEMNKIEKELEKKIKSQIEAKSKNDPSFWDDFNENPEKYYKQPTGVITKSKNFLKKLWPKTEVKSEEQLKREELIRSEARRQFENIQNNRLELDKISTEQTKYESSIEEINSDPLLAQMIRAFNREQISGKPTCKDQAKKIAHEKLQNEQNSVDKNLEKPEISTKDQANKIAHEKLQNEQNSVDKNLEKPEISTKDQANKIAHEKLQNEQNSLDKNLEKPEISTKDQASKRQKKKSESKSLKNSLIEEEQKTTELEPEKPNSKIQKNSFEEETPPVSVVNMKQSNQQKTASDNLIDEQISQKDDDLEFELEWIKFQPELKRQEEEFQKKIDHYKAIIERRNNELADEMKQLDNEEKQLNEMEKNGNLSKENLKKLRIDFLDRKKQAEKYRLENKNFEEILKDEIIRFEKAKQNKENAKQLFRQNYYLNKEKQKTSTVDFEVKMLKKFQQAEKERLIDQEKDLNELKAIIEAKKEKLAKKNEQIDFVEKQLNMIEKQRKLNMDEQNIRNNIVKQKQQIENVDKKLIEKLEKSYNNELESIKEALEENEDYYQYYLTLYSQRTKRETNEIGNVNELSNDEKNLLKEFIEDKKSFNKDIKVPSNVQQSEHSGGQIKLSSTLSTKQQQQSSNFIDSLAKRIQKTMNQTIFSTTAATQQLPEQLYNDYTRQI